MLGLPASTEIRKVITKKKVFEHFGADMTAELRKSFDACTIFPLLNSSKGLVAKSICQFIL